MPDNPSTGNATGDEKQTGPDKSATDNIREVTEASKQLLHASQQMTDNLAELSQRAQRATHVGAQVARSPWLIVAAAIAGGTLLITLSRKRRG